MCGRFALHGSEEEIVSHFRLSKGFAMRPQYNIAPTHTIPVVVSSGEIEFCRWGFIPSWAKSVEILPPGLINARIETIQEKPSFKNAYDTKRCLIPASGYFEWRTISGKKQPFYIYLKNRSLFAFGGIWSYWHSSKTGKIATCAIITHPAKGALKTLHERMPVIISETSYTDWLSGVKDVQYIKEEDFTAHPVSARMGNPQFKGIESIQSL